MSSYQRTVSGSGAGYTPPVPFNGLAGSTLKPTALATTQNQALPTGVVILAQIDFDVTTTLSMITTTIAVAGSILTSGESFMAVLDSQGNTLGVTADQSTAWASTGLKTAALTVVGGKSLAVTAGTYGYVGFLCNGTTPATPNCMAGAGAAAINLIATGTTARKAFFGPSSQTVFPTSVSLVSSQHDKIYLAGVW